MVNFVAAEYLLSLFTDRERASAIVGDFLEESLQYNPFSFWSRVLFTTASLFAHALLSAPLTIIGMAVVGFACEILLNRLLPISGTSFGSVILPFVLGALLAGLTRDREAIVCGTAASLTFLVIAVSDTYSLYHHWITWPLLLRFSTNALIRSVILFHAGAIVRFWRVTARMAS